MKPPVTVRPAACGDEAQLWALICGLAAYEHLEHELSGSPESLAADLFGPSPHVGVLVAAEKHEERSEEQQAEDRRLVGYAMYYPTYDSYAGTRGLWLTDLFITPTHRGTGLGRALLGGLARVAQTCGASRLEWDVLEWNIAALGFYRRAGAVPTPGWARQRLAGAALTALAAECSG